MRMALGLVEDFVVVYLGFAAGALSVVWATAGMAVRSAAATRMMARIDEDLWITVCAPENFGVARI